MCNDLSSFFHIIKFLLTINLFITDRSSPMNKTFATFAFLLITINIICCFELKEDTGVGYRIGHATGFKLVKQYNKSKLYDVESTELDDGRPLKLLQLVGTHYQAGYAYAALLGPQIVETFHTFLGAEFHKQWQVLLLQAFLSWQYDTVVGIQIPHQFKQQLRGLQDGGSKVHSIHNLRSIFEQTLVVSSYPGDFTNDIMYTLLDQLIRQYLPFHNEKLINIIEDKLFEAVKFLKNILNKKRIHCSFFALWGQRTEGGKLITMRNLDWEANTGINKYKTVFVWKITGTIPHTTIGFPGLLGALTGMSKAGLTVHEAGLDSMRATQLGFQWSLRLRYVMMHASNLKQAKKIWEQTNNTLGMNHMIASASDLVTDHPALVMETMRNYTAWFIDDDQRQRGTIFVDPKTKQKFRAGWAMKQAVFRTNHAYDPKINKYRTFLPSSNTSTVLRYITLKSGIQFYQQQNIKISNEQAINITAATAHKGGNNPHKCPGPGDQGTNVFSVVYLPAMLDMYVGFQYGTGPTYRTGCCGVYVLFQMERWFK